MHVPATTHELARAWVTEPSAGLTICLVLAWYLAGIRRLWRRAGAGHGVTYPAAGLFIAGMLVLVLALLSPLHALGGALFSAHMTQHVLLMSVAAPLLILSRPTPAFIWALPAEWRLRAQRLLHVRLVHASWRKLNTPAAAWSIHALALWLWHAPPLYDATVRSPVMHGLQHASFVTAALLFWWVLYTQLFTRKRAALGLLFLFTTAVHASLLGALLTFAREPWYAVYAQSTSAWGLSAVEDLQLGGLIMWVPGGFPYLWAMLLVTATWLREEPARQKERAAAPSAPLLPLRVDRSL